MTKRLTPVTHATLAHWRMPASRHAHVHVHVHVKELRRLSGHAAMADWQEKSNGRSKTEKGNDNKIYGEKQSRAFKSSA
jgi:hypothetical protein